jgi:hypothetical protein
MREGVLDFGHQVFSLNKGISDQKLQSLALYSRSLDLPLSHVWSCSVKEKEDF